MSIRKKSYYLKLKDDFFKNEKIILLENEKNGVIYINILLKFYLLSLKSAGVLLKT